MTKRLEEILNIGPNKEPYELPPQNEAVKTPVINLEDKLEEFDKICNY